jgi:hypothetical protein
MFSLIHGIYRDKKVHGSKRDSIRDIEREKRGERVIKNNRRGEYDQGTLNACMEIS